VDSSKGFDAIVIMAKRPARRKGPRELEARAALGILFWQQTGGRVTIICVEGHDLPDSDLSGAEVVHNVAVAAGVPRDHILTRPLTNCTVREVVAIRDILRELDARQPLVITHPYHVRRTRWYLREAGIGANVIGCSAELAIRTFPSIEASLLRLIERGEAHGLNYAREFVVEILLTILHSLDRGGRVEMRLADRIRGRTGNQTG
jgi:uncharacterized SAM-binding protein YcdF (DUF218 family)